MNKKVIIFGASVGGLKVYKMLVSMGIECLYFVDNSKSKWGSCLEDVEIRPPETLKGNDHNIVIASVYQEEIEQQLDQMGIDRKRIVTREQLVGGIIDPNIGLYKEKFAVGALHERQRSLVIELDHGLLVGGIESWSYLLASESIRSGMDAVIYTDTESDLYNAPADIRNCIRCMDVSKRDFEGEIMRKAQDMLPLLPCIFIANWMEQSFWAAYILKQMYPDKVYLLGMVHHDALCYYRRNQSIQDRVDAFLCVSDDTQRRMTEEFGIAKDKVFYKEIPIAKNSFNRTYDPHKPLTIGVGARLDKAMKRVDLLLPLFDCLKLGHVKYQFQIAGDGAYYEKLSAGIAERQLEDKVTLLGSLKAGEMHTFWQGCDIVVSTSESEGMGLSILEAMSYGCVPVVTDTAGIRRFVTDGSNGYVADIGNMGLLASRIKGLSENRSLLKEMSGKARSTIQEKCAPDGYVTYIRRLSEGGVKNA